MICLCVYWGSRKSNTAKPPTSMLVSTICAPSQTLLAGRLSRCSVCALVRSVSIDSSSAGLQTAKFLKTDEFATSIGATLFPNNSQGTLKEQSWFTGSVAINNKAKIKDLQGKQVECKIVRVEALRSPTAASVTPRRSLTFAFDSTRTGIDGDTSDRRPRFSRPGLLP
jgi:hypothetical protein